MKTREERRHAVSELLRACVECMDQQTFQVVLVPGCNITHEQLRSKTNLSTASYYRALRWCVRRGYLFSDRNNRKVNGKFWGFAGAKKVSKRLIAALGLSKLIKKAADYKKQSEVEAASIREAERRMNIDPDRPRGAVPKSIADALKHCFKRPP